MNIINPCPHALTHDCPLRPEKPVFGFDGCMFHNADRAVVLENGHEIALADVLWRNFGRVVSHDQLWSAVYGALPDADLPGDPDNVIKVKLCHLRKKLKRVRVLIRPVYKLGYRMENAA